MAVIVISIRMGGRLEAAAWRRDRRAQLPAVHFMVILLAAAAIGATSAL